MDSTTIKVAGKKDNTDHQLFLLVCICMHIKCTHVIYVLGLLTLAGGKTSAFSNPIIPTRLVG